MSKFYDDDYDFFESCYSDAYEQCKIYLYWVKKIYVENFKKIDKVFWECPKFVCNKLFTVPITLVEWKVFGKIKIFILSERS